MRALIGPDLLRKLTSRNLDMPDQKLNGYVLRCRTSGTHSYLVNLGRGRWTTIGRVGDISPETARLAAESLLSGVARDTLKSLSELNLRDALERAARCVARLRSRFGGFRRCSARRHVPILRLSGGVRRGSKEA